ncbi:MAG TPA: rhodanese-like domain-containing protein, partial [Azonexus sp.]|nr:rhodanese-like domain-containing protein [Azonexus sp.]
MSQPPTAGQEYQRPRKGIATLDEIAGFDTIIDTRSPAEFADDHLPGAISCPVLDNAQRAEIGTLYKQVSPFAAKKLGAAYVSANIARHLQENFLDRDKGWRPLIVCWRGGMRSGAMTTVFRSVGWDACQLEGGYKAFRHHVISEIG